jgi:K+-sensing histidine kinase KdpD
MVWKRPNGVLWGSGVRFAKVTRPVAVSAALVFAVTAVLWWFKIASDVGQHLVFFYLLPAACVAILYGSVVSMLFAITATACAAFFLYNPLYSFHISDPRELGELICFAGLALIGAKCVGELMRPVEKRSRKTDSGMQRLR